MNQARSRVVTMPAPFDLKRTLRPWAAGILDPSIRLGDRTVDKAARLAAGPVALRFEHEGDEVKVSAWGPGADEALEDAEAMLGKHDDPSALDTDDPDIRALAKRFAGVRIGRAPSLHEVLITTIIQQRVTTKEATDSVRTLLRRYGGPAPGPLDLPLPPDPAELARLPYYAYHPIGVEKRRADVVRFVAKRPKRIRALRELPIAEAKKKLLSIDGIGPWTTGLAAGIALGDPDAVPTGDYHLPNVVAWALAGEPRADDARMLELLEPFAGQRWRVLRLIRMSGVGAPRFGPRKGPGHWNRRR